MRQRQLRAIEWRTSGSSAASSGFFAKKLSIARSIARLAAIVSRTGVFSGLRAHQKSISACAVSPLQRMAGQLFVLAAGDAEGAVELGVLVAVGDAAMADAPAVQHLLDDAEPAEIEQAAPQIVILRVAVRGIVAPGALVGRTAEHHLPVPADPVGEAVVERDQRFGADVLRHHPDRAVIVEMLDVTGRRDEVRPGVEQGDLPLEAVGQREIVGVHPRDQRRAGERHAVAKCPGEAGVFLADDTDTRIAPRVVGQDRARAVGRAVVDDDEFEIAERLLEDAFDRIGQMFLAIVDRHDDRNARFHLSPSAAVREALSDPTE